MTLLFKYSIITRIKNNKCGDFVNSADRATFLQQLTDNHSDDASLDREADLLVEFLSAGGTSVAFYHRLALSMAETHTCPSTVTVIEPH